MSFNVGENVGPYRIVEQLGQGGMATVLKAFHAALDRYVALKVLHPAFGQDPNFEARFQREARLVAKLEHPHIVPVYDFAEHEHRPYLVMKFIEGDTLKARLVKGPLSSAEINNVVESVGAALAYAHKQGILHRDIKPSNVLIGTDDVMWLADFGLARIAQSGESTLSSDMIMGTPQYISPEQAMGEKNLDEGTDIYSFGVMLYELVVGQVPFNADTPFSIIHDHIYSPLPMPRSINPRVPEPVERVLLKALAKERSDRYPDVDSLVKAFKGAWVEAGVPMQGTAITLRPAALKASAITASARAVSARPPTASAPPPAVMAPAPTASVPTASVPVPAARQTPTWLYVVGGIVVLACLAAAGLAAVRGGFLASRASPQTQSNPGAPSAAAGTQAAPAQAGPTATSTVGPTQTVPPAVVSAAVEASKNPGDPKVQLKLALAYWDAGMNHSSLDTLAKAADLAGTTNTAFFQGAGDQYAQRQGWIAAAAMYVRAIKSLGSGGQPSDELITSYHEALYNASPSADVPTYLSFDDLASVEQPIALVAQARYLYYNGDTAKAHQLLNQAFALKPHMAEASLLQAEMDANEGKSSDAKQILNLLMADLSSPDWVRGAAQALSTRIP